MDWSTGQPELPPGTLIQFRSGSRGRRYRVIRKLGHGQSFVYEGVEEIACERNLLDYAEQEESAVVTPPSKRPLLGVDRTPSGRFAKKSRSLAPSPSPTKPGKKRAVALTASGPSIEILSPSSSSIAKLASSSGTSMTKLSPSPSLMAAATSSPGPSETRLSPGPSSMAAITTCSGPNKNVAIKLQYTRAKAHRTEVSQGKAMGQLGYEWDVMTDIQEKVGEGVVTAGLCCGWVEIKLPDELWMALREVHSAGYVHGDIKPANFLVDGKQVLVSDVESAMELGTPLTADYAATPFYQSLPYLAHRLDCHATNKTKLVRPVSTTVTDKGMDFWAVGIMLLEEYYPQYLEVHFPFDALMEKLKVKQMAELEAKVLEDLRYAYSQLYDEHAYEGFEGNDASNAADTDDAADAHAKVPDSIKALLRYCIRRPSNCGLLGRNESTPAELAGILEKMKLDLDEPIPAEAATSSVASTSTSSTRKKQPSGIIRNQAESKQTGSALGKIVLDKTHHPVRLPHGECQMVWDESTGRFAMDVPGILEEKKRTYTFTQCPVDHAVGYEQVRPRYICGNCEYRTYDWPTAKKHIPACHKGAKAEKLIGETS